MPHATMEKSPVHRASLNAPAFKFPNNPRTSMEKFPDHNEHFVGQLEPLAPENGKHTSNERWQPRREGPLPAWSSLRGTRHGRQPSLSDAIRTIKGRRASVSDNMHEVAQALKAPVSPKLIVLCLVWYMSSALTNTSSKSILNSFSKPATLTLIQFAFVAGSCLLFSWLASIFPNMKNAIPALRHGIKPPTKEVIMTTMPLAAFQIGGHLLSASATARIPVSMVHTIKGLSPLFTVFAYRVIFDIRYPFATYLSLIPLTLGVMLACSADLRGNFTGLFFAFLAAIIFVTQNIFSKRLFNEAAKAEAEGRYAHSKKLDKLNLLCYSSGMAFLLTIPLWFFSEGLPLLQDFLADGSLDLATKPNAFDHGRLALEFIFNGVFHFGQNIIAFVLLSMVSPVTYSVASLIKRVFVVVMAILWFRSPTTLLQGVGIALTFFGLYLYDRTSGSNKADRKARMMDIKEETLLPLNTMQPSSSRSMFAQAPVFESPITSATASGNPYMAKSGYSHSPNPEEQGRTGRPRGHSHAAWLPPGTKQEDTWTVRDSSTGLNGKSVAVS